MMQKLLITALVLSFASCTSNTGKNCGDDGNLVAEAATKVSYIEAEALKTMIDSGESFYLIDCREEEEFDSSCIRSATNIPRGILEGTISEQAPKKRNKLIVYCSNGERSTLAATVLPLLKYTDVQVLKGGFDGLKVQFSELVELNPVRGNADSKPVAKPSGGCGG